MLEPVGHLITAQMCGVDDGDVCRPPCVYRQTSGCENATLLYTTQLLAR